MFSRIFSLFTHIRTCYVLLTDKAIIKKLVPAQYLNLYTPFSFMSRVPPNPRMATSPYVRVVSGSNPKIRYRLRNRVIYEM